MNNNQNNNSDNVKSIHDFDFNVICNYFSSLDRQGPGSDVMTRKALNAVPALGKGCVVADLGCGTGSQTLQLALGTDATVKALDLFPLFIDKLSGRCANAGVGNRVEAIVGDMGDLPFAPASIDMIWSEGAIYN
ncbi:MAG: class I SAM-dependent methyltransferase, partial [Prevotella sp.]